MAFQSLKTEFAAKNCSILGCSNDEQDKNAFFAEELGFEYPLLCDTDLSIAIAYGAAADASAGKAARIAALIDEDGKVAQYWNPVCEPGKAGEFPAEALKAL